jgi:hypothetical protein
LKRNEQNINITISRVFSFYLESLIPTIFNCLWKSMDEHLADTIFYSFFEIYYKSAVNIALAKQVIYYGPRSGFWYYDMTHPQKDTPVQYLGKHCMSSSVGSEPWDPSPVSNIWWWNLDHVFKSTRHDSDFFRYK